MLASACLQFAYSPPLLRLFFPSSPSEPYCSAILYTQVEREGLMQGPDFERLRRLRKLTRLPIIAAGGISSLEEIAMLQNEGISSVLGRALYTGKIEFTALLNSAP
jgi:phosphoribosylformimino-5-aminoimidazole carboxamide ribotide isomerase